MNNEYGIKVNFGDLETQFIVCETTISKAMENIYKWVYLVCPDALQNFMESFYMNYPRISSYEVSVPRGPGIIKIYGVVDFCYFNKPWHHDNQMETIEIPNEVKEWKDPNFNVF